MIVQDIVRTIINYELTRIRSKHTLYAKWCRLLGSHIKFQPYHLSEVSRLDQVLSLTDNPNLINWQKQRHSTQKLRASEG